MASSTGLGGSPFASSLFHRRRRKLRTLPFVQQCRWADTDDAEATVLSDWVWGARTATIARGQYGNDQATPIAVGASTSDGITTSVWLETEVYTGTPITNKVTLNVENEILATGFDGTATGSATARQFKVPTLPTSRRGGSLIYDAKNKRFVLFGGYDGTTRYNQAWELSADSAYHRWRQIIPSGTPPSAKNLAGAVYVRGTTSGAVDKAYMVVWGGATPSDSNEMHALDITTPGSESWATISQTSTPAARAYLTHHMAAKTTASNTTDIYLFGGWGASRTNDLLRCTFNVNSPTAVTWTTLKANGAVGSPSGRSGTGMIYDVANDRLILTSGYNGTSYLSDVWEYNISGAAFNQLSPGGTSPTGRELCSIGYDAINQRALIIGGWRGNIVNDRNDIIQLSLSTGSEAWTQIKSNDLANQGILAFSNASCAVDTARNMMVISTLNGYDSTDKYVYAFNLNDTSTSAPLYSVNIVDHFRSRDAPAYTYDSTRGEMLFINGYGGMDDDTTITRGDHISGIWAFDITNSRWRHAAKGPYNILQNEGGLAIYDAANDRTIHFGGLTGTSQKTNDVWQLKADVHGMYQATKLEPAGTLPTERWQMAGCYDAANQRMIIWSGNNASGILTDVWALSLTAGSETWTQLTPTGSAPAGTWQCAFAYDAANSRLYVHAGASNQAGSTFTSQLYYLDTSTTNCAWTDTGVTGGLAVRGAVMGFDATNQRLICFGGYDGSTVTNALRYTNTSSFTSWTTVSADNAPAARRSAGGMVINDTFVVSCGRPVSGTWFNDTQQLNLTASVGSWKWSQQDPSIWQMLSVGVTSLIDNTSYHWQAWITTGNLIGAISSFGSNPDTSADYIVGLANTGQIKVYTGSDWAIKPIKVWNGSVWVTKPLKVWNGSTWVETSY